MQNYIFIQNISIQIVFFNFLLINVFKSELRFLKIYFNFLTL
ncbi:hypothetical protein FSS13T_13160 [Flavobacterium saliperosum S13]|uniref:Uncharacterized protein n=1 Tax=Flavobacterium saliperosum S13 TaxID=1341155 RepID=A0ABN0QHF9_9FLAO|nr:hypothetical protein FSS13T_13160 [Flavobacterium saliperosum S13]